MSRGYPVFDDLDIQAARSGMGVRGAEKRQGQIRLGNSVRINSVGIANLFGPWQQIGPTERLLTINPNDAETEGPGSWVCTLTGKTLVRGPGAPGINYACPAIAYIQFGAGGTMQTVEVDAWKNVIALPSQTVYVDVAYNQFGETAVAGDPAVSPNTLLQEVEFRSTAHRSLETGENIPTRTYYFSVNGVVNTFRVPVPPFATAWCIIPNVTRVTSGSLPYDCRVRTAAGGAIDSPIPEVVESMARTFCFRQLPQGAELIDVEIIGINPASWSGQVIYRIGL